MNKVAGIGGMSCHMAWVAQSGFGKKKRKVPTSRRSWENPGSAPKPQFSEEGRVTVLNSNPRQARLTA